MSGVRRPCQLMRRANDARTGGARRFTGFAITLLLALAFASAVAAVAAASIRAPAAANHVVKASRASDYQDCLNLSQRAKVKLDAISSTRAARDAAHGKRKARLNRKLKRLRKEYES